MIIDLTNEKFDAVDFSESHLLFDIPIKLPERFSIFAWGATLLTNFNKHFWDRIPNANHYNDDVYINGFTEICFSGCSSLFIELSMFSQTENSVEYIKGRNGKVEKLVRSWGEEIGTEYVFDAGVCWPRSGGHIKVSCVGGVQLSYDEKLAIPATKFVLNPQMYAWNPSKGYSNSG